MRQHTASLETEGLCSMAVAGSARGIAVDSAGRRAAGRAYTRISRRRRVDRLLASDDPVDPNTKTREGQSANDGRPVWQPAPDVKWREEAARQGSLLRRFVRQLRITRDLAIERLRLAQKTMANTSELLTGISDHLNRTAPHTSTPQTDGPPKVDETDCPPARTRGGRRRGQRRIASRHSARQGAAVVS